MFEVIRHHHASHLHRAYQYGQRKLACICTRLHYIVVKYKWGNVAFCTGVNKKHKDIDVSWDDSFIRLVLSKRNYAALTKCGTEIV